MATPTRRLLAVLLGTSLGLSVAGVTAPLWWDEVAPRSTFHVYCATSPAELEAFRAQQRRIREALPAGRALRDTLRAELAEGDGLAEWMGEYCSSNGREGHTVLFGPSGFYYEHARCHDIGSLAYGDVEDAVGPYVRLAPRFSSEEGQPEPFATGRLDFRFGTELVRVPWGEEVYLIPTSLLPELCAAANDGYSIQYADYPRVLGPGEEYHHLGVLPAGAPQVPPEHRHLLLEEPVTVRLTELLGVRPEHHPTSPGPDPWAHFRIDGGSALGLWPGVELFAADETLADPLSRVHGRILEVDEHGGEVAFFLLDEWVADVETLVGKRFATRRPPRDG